MPADPELLSALQDAVTRSPNSFPLRLHLASLLHGSGAEATALTHYMVALKLNPAHVDALTGAAAAALAVGEADLATALLERRRAVVAGETVEPRVPVMSAGGWT